MGWGGAAGGLPWPGWWESTTPGSGGSSIDYVDEARADGSHEKVRRLGVDETSLRRGHEYLTLFVDLDDSRVLFAIEGRESDTFRAFREDLEAHGGRGDWLREVCVDMSPAYQKGLRDHLPEANVTFDVSTWSSS